MDQEHSKFVLATGFQYFWRGNAQKERLSVFFKKKSSEITTNESSGSCS